MKRYLLLICALSLLTGGCARNISPDEYSESEIGAVKQTYKGVVIAVRSVTLQGADSLGDNTAGTVGGGLAGGILGSQIGQGRGSVVGMVLGAAAGALGGALTEKSLKSQTAMEYTVELQSGRTMTIVQGPTPPLVVGQQVLVMVGSKGRPRVIADQFAQQQQYDSYRAPSPKRVKKRSVKTSPAVAPTSAPVHQQAPHRSINDIDFENRDRYARDQGLD